MIDEDSERGAPVTAISIDLAELRAPLPTLTAEQCVVMEQAGTFCLENQGHSGMAHLTIQGIRPCSVALSIPPITPQIQAAFAPEERATEEGACGIAILLTRKLLNYPMVERAWRKGGFDYWIGEEVAFPFEYKARLEISGIRAGGELDVRRRVKAKLKQTQQSDETLIPAYVAVVEFSAPLAHLGMR